MKRVLKFKNESMAKRFFDHMQASDENLNVEWDKNEESEEIEVKYELPVPSLKAEASEAKEDDYITSEHFYNTLSRFFQDVHENMRYELNWLASEVRYLEEAFYKHNKGHLPPIKSAGKMEKALNTLGIGEDYEVEKKRIFASASIDTKNGSVEIDL